MARWRRGVRVLLEVVVVVVAEEEVGDVVGEVVGDVEVEVAAAVAVAVAANETFERAETREGKEQEVARKSKKKV